MHKILTFRRLESESSSFQDFRSFSQIVKVSEIFAVKDNTQSYWEATSRLHPFPRFLSLFFDKHTVNLFLAFLPCTAGTRLPYPADHQLLLEISVA